MLNTSLKEKMIIISKLERMRENTSLLISYILAWDFRDGGEANQNKWPSTTGSNPGSFKL